MRPARRACSRATVGASKASPWTRSRPTAGAGERSLDDGTQGQASAEWDGHPSRRDLGRPDHPTGSGVAQHTRSLPIDLDGRLGTLRYLIRDRETESAWTFDDVFASEGVQVVKTPPRTRRGTAVRSGSSVPYGRKNAPTRSSSTAPPHQGRNQRSRTTTRPPSSRSKHRSAATASSEERSTSTAEPPDRRSNPRSRPRNRVLAPHRPA